MKKTGCLEKKLQLLQELKKLAIRNHDYCDDEWYSCPKCPTGCYDESQGDECNCGAEEHNKEVADIYNKLFKCIKDNDENTDKFCPVFDIKNKTF